MTIYELPDGRKFDVPDSVSRDDAIAGLKSKFGKPEFGTPEAAAQNRAELGRDIGLLGRGVLQGVAAPVTLGSDIIGLGVNTLAGREVIPSLSGLVSQTLTDVGFPEPATPGERVAGSVIEGVTGGLGVSQGLRAATPLIGAGAGGAGAAASSVAGELGATPGGQLAVGLVGGVGGGVAAKGLTGLIRAKAPTPDILADITERGLIGTIAFSNVRSTLQAEATKQGKKISKLFEEAKERGQKAFINKDTITELSGKLRQQAVSEIDSEAKVILGNTANILDELTTADLPGGITLNNLETIRRSATKASKSGSSKGFVAGDIRRQIDELLDDPANITGDKQAVTIWKQAITARREFGQKFEKPTEIAKSLTDATNETIAQNFIGSGGASLNKGLSRIYDDTVAALPKEQKTQAGFQLRQSIVNRWIKNAAQSADAPEGVSASRLSNQIRNFRRDNQSMWSKFTDKEQGILTNLEDELRKTAQGGFINKAYSALQRFLSSSIRSNVELPRTLKAKTIVDLDDLVELTRIKVDPGLINRFAPVTIGVEAGITE